MKRLSGTSIKEVLSAILMGLPFIALVLNVPLTLPHLPSELTIHFNEENQVDSTFPTWAFLVIALGVTLLALWLGAVGLQEKWNRTYLKRCSEPLVPLSGGWCASLLLPKIGRKNLRVKLTYLNDRPIPQAAPADAARRVL